MYISTNYSIATCYLLLLLIPRRIQVYVPLRLLRLLRLPLEYSYRRYYY